MFLEDSLSTLKHLFLIQRGPDPATLYDILARNLRHLTPFGLSDAKTGYSSRPLSHPLRLRSQTSRPRAR